MIYVQVTAKVERNKLDEVIELFGKTLFPWDDEVYAKTGGKTIGQWTTFIGEKGEITLLCGFPSLASFEKYYEVSPPEDVQKAINKYKELVPNATYKIMTPTPYSPLK